MRKFNGVPKDQFGLYLKECEWRFNNSDPASQKNMLRQWVRKYLRQLSGPAPNDISREFPYLTRVSIETNAVAQIVIGSVDENECTSNGGFAIPTSGRAVGNSSIEPIIAKLAIIEQFELFKDSVETFDGPFNNKRCCKWENDKDLDLTILKDHIARRNELTHEYNTKLASIREAVEYFYFLVQKAPELSLLRD